MQVGFYFDQTRCTGCFTCIVACKEIEKGNYPDVSVTSLSAAYYHCNEPACATACPVNAISKREIDGVVVVDQKACIGKSCSLCLDACVYKGLMVRKCG